MDLCSIEIFNRILKTPDTILLSFHIPKISAEFFDLSLCNAQKYVKKKFKKKSDVALKIKNLKILISSKKLSLTNMSLAIFFLKEIIKSGIRIPF